MKNTRRFGRRALAAIFLLSACGAAAAAARPKPAPQALPRYGVSVYADLCVQDGSGEIGGQRISLLRFAEVDTVLFEFTAGALSWPLVASEVNIDDKSGAVDFTVLGADDEERKISGKLSPDGQTLVLDGSYCGGDAGMPMRLSKVKDFGAKLKACKPCPPLKEAPQAAPETAQQI